MSRWQRTTPQFTPYSVHSRAFTLQCPFIPRSAHSPQLVLSRLAVSMEPSTTTPCNRYKSSNNPTRPTKLLASANSETFERHLTCLSETEARWLSLSSPHCLHPRCIRIIYVVSLCCACVAVVSPSQRSDREFLFFILPLGGRISLGPQEA